jgi:hypothetical protein
LRVGCTTGRAADRGRRSLSHRSRDGTARRRSATATPASCTAIGRGSLSFAVQSDEGTLEVARFSRERPQLLKTSIDRLADRVDQVRHDAEH